MKKNALFNLIATLSQSEKRYIRIWLNAFSSNGKEYLWLYNLLLKKPDIDENELKIIHKDLKIKRSLSAIKGYLYFELLRVLQNYSKKDQIEKEIINSYLNIQLLLSRGLVVDAYDLLKKLKSSLVEIKSFDNHLRNILFLEYNILHFKSGTDVIDNKNQLLKEWEKSIKDNLQFLESLKIESEYYHQFVSLDSNSFSKKKLDLKLFSEKPFFKNIKNIDHLNSRIISTKNLSHSLNGLGKYDEAQKLIEETNKFIEQIPNQNLRVIAEYKISSLLVLLQIAINKEDGLLFELYHNKLLELKIKDKRTQTQLSGHLWETLLNAVEENLASQNLINFDQLKTYLVSNENKIPSHTYRNIYLLSAIIYFKNKNYNKCLDWIINFNRNLDSFPKENKNLNKNYFFTFKVLEIISNYKLNNIQFTQNLIFNFKRSLKRITSLFPEYLDIITYLQKLVSIPEKYFHKKELLSISFIEKINTYDKTKLNEQILIVFNLENWILSEIKKTHSK